MNRHSRHAIVLVSLGMIGCGGSCPRAADETKASVESAPAPEPTGEAAAVGPAEESKPEPSAKTTTAEASSPDAEPKPAATPEPQFPDNASVSQAIAAIPRGAERANIDPGDLAEPLQNQSVYEPCNIGAQHFKLKVAVWEGHAVGVDVATANKKLAECIDRQVRSIEWRQKVRSLNTVEYSL